MPETLDHITSSYFASTAHAESSPGERIFNEAVQKVYEGEARFELGTDLENAGGLRVCEARAYGITLGAARMVKHWKDHIEYPVDRIRAIRAHFNQLIVALADLEGEIR
jgi:hypothetical protein